MQIRSRIAAAIRTILAAAAMSPQVAGTQEATAAPSRGGKGARRDCCDGAETGTEPKESADRRHALDADALTANRIASISDRASMALGFLI